MILAPVPGPPPPPPAAVADAARERLLSELRALDTPELLVLCLRFRRPVAGATPHPAPDATTRDRLSLYLTVLRSRGGNRAQFSAILVCFDLARLGGTSAQRELTALAPTLRALGQDPVLVEELVGDDAYLRTIWEECTEALASGDPRDVWQSLDEDVELIGELDLLSDLDFELGDADILELEEELLFEEAPADAPAPQREAGAALPEPAGQPVPAARRPPPPAGATQEGASRPPGLPSARAEAARVEFTALLGQHLGHDPQHGLFRHGFGFATSSGAELDRLENFLKAAASRARLVPAAAGLACLGNLFLATHLRRHGLFNRPNPRRLAALRTGLLALPDDPQALAAAAAILEFEGGHVIERFQKVDELLLDYLSFCAQHALDPRTPEAVDAYLAADRLPAQVMLEGEFKQRR